MRHLPYGCRETCLEHSTWSCTNRCPKPCWPFLVPGPRLMPPQHLFKTNSVASGSETGCWVWASRLGMRGQSIQRFHTAIPAISLAARCYGTAPSLVQWCPDFGQTAPCRRAESRSTRDHDRVCPPRQALDGAGSHSTMKLASRPAMSWSKAAQTNSALIAVPC